MSAGVAKTATNSSTAPPIPLLSPLYWSEIYEAARAALGFSRLEDCLAARLAERLAYEAILAGRVVDPCRALVDADVCVAGGSYSLVHHLEELRDCSVVVAADGASSLLLEHGIAPRIVVTDLDGGWSSLCRASSLGAAMIVHVHGDNVAAARLLVPRFESVALTTQCPRNAGGYTMFLPGFTDGERALALPVVCGASRVEAYGMNVEELVGPWSKPWLQTPRPPWPSKRRKLLFAAFFFRALAAASSLLGVRLSFH